MKHNLVNFNTHLISGVCVMSSEIERTILTQYIFFSENINIYKHMTVLKDSVEFKNYISLSLLVSRQDLHFCQKISYLTANENY